MRRFPFCLALVLLGSCTTEPPPPPVDFVWTTFSNPAAGYTLDVPDVYKADVEADGKAVLFRWQGRVPVKVYLLPAGAADRRGLWPGHDPTDQVALDGVAGRRYDYDHCDGPFCSRIVSFVIPWRGEWLALEFRAKGSLHDVNRRILDSFTLDLGADPRPPTSNESGAASRLEAAPAHPLRPEGQYVANTVSLPSASTASTS